MTANPTTAGGSAGQRAPAATIGWPQLLRSELTKLGSLRSTRWTAIFAAATTVVVAGLICARMAYNLSRGDTPRSGFDATATSLESIYLTQVAAAATGALVISSEYGSGLIQATLAAVPQRRALLAAKMVTLAGSALIGWTVITILAFTVGQPFLARAHADASMGDPGVLRAVVGGGLYLTAITLLGFSLGALIQHTAAALTAVFAALFALPVLADVLPTSWQTAVKQYLPVNAGSQIITTVHNPHALTPWAGLAVLCLYIAVLITTAALLTTRRDI